MTSEHTQPRVAPFGGVATQRTGARSPAKPIPPQISFHAPNARAHLSFLRRNLRKILRLLGIQHARWHIRIVRDPEMARLHQRSLSLSATTDVLTFDLRDDPRRKDHEGAPVELDTVLCIDEARRHAAERHHPIQNELLLYSLHSLLHVQGYNDTSAAAFRRMHAREDELLSQIGIGPVFKTRNAKRKTQISADKIHPRKSKTTGRKSPGGAP